VAGIKGDSVFLDLGSGTGNMIEFMNESLRKVFYSLFSCNNFNQSYSLEICIYRILTTRKCGVTGSCFSTL
jgi:hypothetical protein